MVSSTSGNSGRRTRHGYTKQRTERRSEQSKREQRQCEQQRCCRRRHGHAARQFGGPGWRVASERRWKQRRGPRRERGNRWPRWFLDQCDELRRELAVAPEYKSERQFDGVVVLSLVVAVRSGAAA